ncbi:hypothetical protein [Metabacillus fastidiosus]|uniref:hypothetical protein n=1 Tax=Metabacillus fastidiosus TaxID=1458 RepID=UPI000825B91B|nr:hypothetical protein [Metabacillus fastidiosus]MED4460942.1 hypothetical protein [Metabacillus fastidiosus]
MKIRLLVSSLILLILFILQGCETDSMFRQGKKTTYIHHFPEKHSPALTEFINDYILVSLLKEMSKENNRFIFARENRNEEDKNILYYDYTEEQVENYYEPILNADEQSYKILKGLGSTDKVEKELLKPIKDPLIYSLPIFIMEGNNQLRIKTTLNETVLNLPILMKEYGMKETDRIVFDLLESNKNHFILEIADYDVKNSTGKPLFLTLFVKKDFSEIVISEWFDEAIQKKLDKGDLDSFLGDFRKVGESGRYAFLYGRTIVDTKTKKIVKINEEDYLSNDGKYVYINGGKDDLPDGVQKIQMIDNYMAGNKVYEIEYQLDYKEIAKELNFVTSGIGLADINYFSENYVILGLTYNGKMVGEAGFTNVIIDFQKNKEDPVFYLNDLHLSGIQIK